MDLANATQYLAFLALVTLITKLLGGYLHRVFTRQRTLLDAVCLPLEQLIVRLCRADSTEETFTTATSFTTKHRMRTRLPSGTARGRWLHLLPVLLLAGIGSFVVGTQFLVIRPAPLAHPLTGRVIPGMATDATWLDRAEREGEETPDRALELIGITPGMSVADVGAGTGYMTLRIARLVGPTGKVYANDVQPAMLRTLQEKTHQEQLGNVEIVQGADDDARLPVNVVDLVVLVDVYHEFRQPQAMLRSIRRSLRPNGRLVLVEYRKEDPRIPIANTHRMSIVEARVEVETEGFTFDRVVEGLPRQHIIVFRRPVVQ